MTKHETSSNDQITNARFNLIVIRHSFGIGRSSFFILFLLFFGVLLRYGECASPPPTPAVADNRLPTPQAESERKYLGLSPAIERFSLDNVQADILILDFFDMYCHVCQSRARHMNDFYQLVQSRGLSGRVRVLGVGVGDTPKEVTVFKEKFELPFPVFPDRTGSFSRQFCKIRVPNVIVLKRHLGHFEVCISRAQFTRQSGTVSCEGPFLRHHQDFIACA